MDLSLTKGLPAFDFICLFLVRGLIGHFLNLGAQVTKRHRAVVVAIAPHAIVCHGPFNPSLAHAFLPVGNNSARRASSETIVCV